MPINIIIRLNLAVKQRSGGADPADVLVLALVGSMMMAVDVEQRRIPRSLRADVLIAGHAGLDTHCHSGSSSEPRALGAGGQAPRRFWPTAPCWLSIPPRWGPMSSLSTSPGAASTSSA
jgi:hypothetical protein